VYKCVSFLSPVEKKEMAGEGDGGREAEEEEEEEEEVAALSLSSLLYLLISASKFTRAIIDQPP